MNDMLPQRGRAATKGLEVISTRRRLPKVWYAALRKALMRQRAEEIFGERTRDLRKLANSWCAR
jgi:hypothetical protein